MADVRCPLCGKPNPEELEVCQFCQARLKPLTGAGESELEAWLGSLRAGSTGEDQPASSLSWERSDDDSADWLANLRAEQDEQADREAGAGEGEWVAPPPGFDAQDEEFPDWLADIRSQAIDASSAEPVEPVRPEPPKASAPLPREDAEPDWLRRIRARKQEEEAAQEGGPELPEEEPGGEPLPDWLAGFDEPSENAASQGDVPDWLASSQPPPSLPVMQPPSDDIPDWLLGRQRAPEIEQPPEAEVPHWLAGLEQEGSRIEPSETQTKAGEAPPAPGEMPEWLAGSRQPEAEEPDSQSAMPTSIFSVPEDGELPGWLSGLAAAAGKETVSSEEKETGEAVEIAFDELAISEHPSGDLPFQGEQPLQSETNMPSGGAVSPFIGDLPDWEGGLIPGAESPESEMALPEEPGLARAELPSWLEAMRPVESAAPVIPNRRQDEQKVISSGPLAGLRGVLPAEPDVASQRAPEAYTLKLKLSDSHQAQAELLEKMIKREGVPRALPEAPVISSQLLLRLLVFLALVAAVVAQSVFGLAPAPPPAIPPAVFSARTVVDSLTPGQPVLVAVDYPAGFSGEMEAVASGLLDHLMIKGNYLALVSTQPGGPALAEHLIDTANAFGGHTYSEVNQYANLGYIPGGTAGLFAFVQSPPQVLPLALNADEEDNPWKVGALTGITRLSDFSAVIVITNDPEIGRSWVEQTRSNLAGKPLLMLVSAQAEPLIRPYYEGTPQLVNGMLAGIAGGAAYEASLVRNGLGGRYWSMLGLGVVVAAVLILLFGLLGLIIDRLSRPRGKTVSQKEPAS